MTGPSNAKHRSPGPGNTGPHGVYRRHKEIRLCCGIRFDEADGALLYAYAKDEEIATEIEDDSLRTSRCCRQILTQPIEVVVVLRRPAGSRPLSQSIGPYGSRMLNAILPANGSRRGPPRAARAPALAPQFTHDLRCDISAADAFLCEIFELRAGMARRGNRYQRAALDGFGLDRGDGTRGRRNEGLAASLLQFADAIERGAELDPLRLRCRHPPRPFAVALGIASQGGDQAFARTDA